MPDIRCPWPGTRVYVVKVSRWASAGGRTVAARAIQRATATGSRSTTTSGGPDGSATRARSSAKKAASHGTRVAANSVRQVRLSSRAGVNAATGFGTPPSGAVRAHCGAPQQKMGSTSSGSPVPGGRWTAWVWVVRPAGPVAATDVVWPSRRLPSRIAVSENVVGSRSAWAGVGCGGAPRGGTWAKSCSAASRMPGGTPGETAAKPGPGEVRCSWARLIRPHPFAPVGPGHRRVPRRAADAIPAEQTAPRAEFGRTVTGRPVRRGRTAGWERTRKGGQGPARRPARPPVAWREAGGGSGRRW
ncbi:hypothetical protein SDIAM26S_01590 [Streptomyces diastaticus subsp. diastaticus]